MKLEEKRGEKCRSLHQNHKVQTFDVSQLIFYICTPLAYFRLYSMYSLESFKNLVKRWSSSLYILMVK